MAEARFEPTTPVLQSASFPTGPSSVPTKTNYQREEEDQTEQGTCRRSTSVSLERKLWMMGSLSGSRFEKETCLTRKQPVASMGRHALPRNNENALFIEVGRADVYLIARCGPIKGTRELPSKDRAFVHNGTETGRRVRWEVFECLRHHVSLWRNRLARSAVNREDGGSSPPRDGQPLGV